MGLSIRPVTASKTGVTVTVRGARVDMDSTRARIRSTLPAGVLDADDVGVLGQFGTSSMGML
jgi:hypothetical protein